MDAFEAAYAELQRVIDQLEQGGLGLDAAIALYERGVELSARCEAIVQRARLRVQQVTGGDDGLAF